MKFRQHRKSRRLRHLLSIPFIWAPFIFVLILDLFTELYHRICFPLYGIPYLSRKNYIKLDRYKLPRLNLLEKINCLYCEYVNGFAHYFSTIAGKTEEYWCGIKHEMAEGFIEPAHQKHFDERKMYE